MTMQAMTTNDGAGWSDHPGGLRRVRLALGTALVLLSLAAAAPAHAGDEYQLFYFSDDGSLITPNPFPSYLALHPNDQVALKIDARPDQPDTFYLKCDSFQPAFGGTGDIFVSVPQQVGTPGEIALLIPGTIVTTPWQEFHLTFTDLGTYTISVGIDVSHLTTFHVAVLPAGSGAAMFAGSWDANVFYPANSIVATGGIFTGLDFWIEANDSGSHGVAPALGASDWYHMSGAGTPGAQGPPGPAGDPGATGPAGDPGATGPAGDPGAPGDPGRWGRWGSWGSWDRGGSPGPRDLRARQGRQGRRGRSVPASRASP